MTTKRILYILTITAIFFIGTGRSTYAQNYKLRQVTSVMGMKSESTIYVKGMRKRTEGGGMMGMGANLVTIEQCDLQRTITINDKKRLYFIEPFSTPDDEVIDEDAKPTAEKNKPVTKNTDPKKGGTITMWYSITDTGERKKMYGFTARHVWTNRKMKPSENACSMKDSFIIKTDGWYIDLPQFNCPVQYRPVTTANRYEKPQTDCKDRFVTRRRGKGKLGFPLIETTTMIMGGQSESNSFETNLETLELSTAKLDSMLFEIPVGYQLASSKDELQDKMDINALMKQYGNQDNNNNNNNNAGNKTEPGAVKKAGGLRIGVYLPTGNDQVQPSVLQQHLVSYFNTGNIDAVPVSSEEEAKAKDCDYTLATNFIKVKQANKVGGLLKAIKNADPNASMSFNIDAEMTLVKLADGSTKSKPKVSGKYEGRPDDAASKALDEGGKMVLRDLK